MIESLFPIVLRASLGSSIYSLPHLTPNPTSCRDGKYLNSLSHPSSPSTKPQLITALQRHSLPLLPSYTMPHASSSSSLYFSVFSYLRPSMAPLSLRMKSHPAGAHPTLSFCPRFSLLSCPLQTHHRSILIADSSKRSPGSCVPVLPILIAGPHLLPNLTIYYFHPVTHGFFCLYPY